MLHLINKEVAGCRYFVRKRYKPLIERFLHTIWPMFSSFLIFCCYVTCSSNKWAKYEKLENIGHIVFGILQ